MPVPLEALSGIPEISLKLTNVELRIIETQLKCGLERGREARQEYERIIENRRSSSNMIFFFSGSSRKMVRWAKRQLSLYELGELLLQRIERARQQLEA